MSILISPHELSEKIYRGDKTTILASLWAPGEGEAFNQFSSLHIPTAQYANAASAFVGLPGSKVGRNPLPQTEKVQEWIDHWGLHADSEVVVYDEGRGLFAGRAWWTLRWAGIRNVRILDGGLSNWRAQSLPTLTGPGNLGMPSDFKVTTGSMPTATIDEVKDHQGLLLDVRTRNRFAGRRENLDLKAGHIPGAVNLPERLFHTEDITVWKSKEEILEILDDHGVTKENVDGAIIYSGSGNHSALTIAVLEYVGFTGLRHFVGGWSQWSANPKNPVERGDREHV
ncbi:sulfurtransferase [Corynebacterium aurimucosum]|uniref:Sulfurtransferase n=1 Tax=Corynebacterium aurimucosum TaxID=169292 RepID=A0A558ISW3_9CORY|nr:sulfurtransferase [Corynebacterium aurimucosum]TVU84466.1 sulfurtransferase [Corynebacterium aurimucosum]